MHKSVIVILNFNGRNHLETFLPSVTMHSNCPIYVADNASTDDSVSFVRSKYPEISIIQLEKNYGFAGGYNRALKEVQAEYFVLLNSDVEVTSNWIQPMEVVLDQNPQVAAVQPKILSYTDKSKFDYAGAAGGYLDILAYPYCRGRVFEHIEKDVGQYDDEREIFWAGGACFAIRSSVFHQLEGFDQDFFAHMEEIDLCWRLHHLEKKVYFTPASKVYHLGGGTLASESPFKTYLNFRNSLMMIYKNCSSQYRTLILFFRMLLDAPAALRFLLLGKFKNSWAVLKAHVSFYQYLFSKKSKKMDKHGFKHYYRIKTLLVYQYFILRRKTFNEIQ